ncbi:MAG: hypothetical protein AB7O67_21815 [Vicinamibacterales bacterium]
MKVVWEETALQLLESRDRYTRNAIREDFRTNPERDAVEIDPALHEFVTPVAGRRFTVVWRRDAATDTAIVRAVVPLTGVTLEPGAFVNDEALGNLRAYVHRAVAAESKGLLDF